MQTSYGVSYTFNFRNPAKKNWMTQWMFVSIDSLIVWLKWVLYGRLTERENKHCMSRCTKMCLLFGDRIVSCNTTVRNGTMFWAGYIQLSVTILILLFSKTHYWSTLRIWQCWVWMQIYVKSSYQMVEQYSHTYLPYSILPQCVQKLKRSWKLWKRKLQSKLLYKGDEEMVSFGQ